ncbi:MAG: PepSY domain-containing protein [Methyloglobulus sp.]|nr:PepSY domain-containing protein [Methyloglobulus sp.]
MFAIIGLTGSLIVFWQPLDALLNPDLFRTTTGCALSLYRPLDDIVAAAQTHAPDKGKLRLLTFPNPERPVFTAAYEVPAPGTDWDDRYIVFVEPCNGLVTGSRFYDSQLRPLDGPLMGVAIRIHTSLLLNFPGFWLGNNLISFGSVFIACSMLIGVYLWWPRNRRWLTALTIKRRSSRERFNYDLHKVFGVFAGFLLLVSLFTGIHMYSPWTEWIDQGINNLSPVTRLTTGATSSQLTPGKKVISAEQALKIASANIPQSYPISLAFPGDEQGVYSITLKSDSVWDGEVIIDQYSGKILQLYGPNNATAGDHFLGWLFPLHTGQAFGLTGRILILFLGLMPILLYVTGFIRWRQKRKSRRLHISKQTTY